MIKENVIKSKSFLFAIRIVNICKVVISEHREFIISKQLTRSGTAVGALYREAEHAESRKDFIHKLAIAQKECNESIYWIELLHATDYIEKEDFISLKSDAEELLKLLTSIIKTSKKII
jgi:four helix bundle protein